MELLANKLSKLIEPSFADSFLCETGLCENYSTTSTFFETRLCDSFFNDKHVCAKYVFVRNTFVRQHVCATVFSATSFFVRN